MRSSSQPVEGPPGATAPLGPPFGRHDSADAGLQLVPAAPDASVRVLDTRVDMLSADQVLQSLASPESTSSPLHLAYVNAHSLNLAFVEPSFREALSRCQIVLNDGIGLSLAARMRGARFEENLNGSDFTLHILGLAADRGWRVFLYGGRPGVATAAAKVLKERISGLTIAGCCDGYTGRSADEITSLIREARADVVIVALGQPIQELWLDRHLSGTGAHLGLGVGAFLDFISGQVSRAPQWMNRLGVEWLFRLAHEPRRLWRRYLVGGPVFLWRAWRLRAQDVSSL